jgi:CHASE2 domain-containing sensor protein
MHLAQLLTGLFDLRAQTNVWNSTAAARDFWMAVAIIAALCIATFAIRNARPHPTPRLRNP